MCHKSLKVQFKGVLTKCHPIIFRHFEICSDVHDSLELFHLQIKVFN